MSKENTKKFLTDVVGNSELATTLLSSPSSSWISSAKTKGYDITTEELADELIGRIRELYTGELGDGSLDAVTGGAGSPQLKAATPHVAVAPVAGMKLQPVGGLKLPGRLADRW